MSFGAGVLCAKPLKVTAVITATATSPTVLIDPDSFFMGSGLTENGRNNKPKVAPS